MDEHLQKLFSQLLARGWSPTEAAALLAEVTLQGDTGPMPPVRPRSGTDAPGSVYGAHDLAVLQDMSPPGASETACLRSLDELLSRDRQREQDGFPRKIRVGRLIKPGKGGKGKVVVVPTTVEEKFLHDKSPQTPEEEEQSGGFGEGEPGEVIGEEPLRPAEGAGTGAGEGDSEEHELESNAYDLGKILTEQFELPNLRDKGKKRSLTRYTYDLTDRNRGFGQVLDKKATLRQILETNISLGNVPRVDDVDTTRLLVAPQDMIYRILSPEKDFESQAMVFFLRDYSGSMQGKATELVVSQHVLIYSWLLYQYERQVETRFVLHDTEAKEVPDFLTYYRSAVAGGTRIVSAYRLVNAIVEEEQLAKDYNIYIFHGTDGDDWDKEGKETLPELNKMLAYANRVGITIAEHPATSLNNTEVERYLKKSGLLTEKPALLRLDVLQEDADEKRLIESIKTLISP